MAAEVRAFNSVDQAIASGTGWTALALDSELFDTDAMHHLTVNNGRITFKTAGAYVVAHTNSWEFGNTGWRQIGIRLNGTTFLARSSGDPQGADLVHLVMNVTTIYDFAAGDYIEMVVRHTQGVSLNVNKVYENTPYVSVQLAQGDVELKAQAGNFALNTATGLQQVTGLPFEPKLVLFFFGAHTQDGVTVHSQIGFGAASEAGDQFVADCNSENAQADSDSSRQHDNTACISLLNAGLLTSLARATFSQMLSNGFEINVTTAPATALRIGYLALGGAALTHMAGGVIIQPAATGDQAATGVGFRPNAGMFSGVRLASNPPGTGGNGVFYLGMATGPTAEGVTAVAHNDTGEQAWRYQRTSRCIANLNPAGTLLSEAEFKQFDDDGFTVTWLTASATATRNFYLMLRFDTGAVKVGSLTTQASLGQFSETGAGFRPAAALFASFCNPVVATIQTHAELSIGAATAAAAQFVTGETEEHAQSPTDCDNFQDDADVYLNYDFAQAKEGEIAFVQFDSDGFTLDQIDADPTGNELIYMLFGPAVAAVQTVAVGQVVESDTAQALTSIKALAVGQTVEADLAQAATILKAQAIGLVSEINVAQALGATLKSKVLGLVTETDFAQIIAVVVAKIIVVNQAAETDLAQTLTRIKTAGLAQALETDLSQAVASAKAKLLVQVLETDLAQAVSENPKRRLVNQIVETDLAQSAASAKALALGQSIESDLSQVLTIAKALAIAQAVEADLAQPASSAKALAIAQALEADIAQALSSLKLKLLGLVIELDLAQPIAAAGEIIVALGQALETDLAQLLGWAPKHRLIGLVSETDAAQASGPLKSVLISQAIESDLSQALSIAKAMAVGQALEADLVQALTAVKALAIAQAIETDTAQTLSSSKLKLLGIVSELDLAQPVSAIGQIIVALGQVLETDLAQLLTWAPKHRLVGLASELDEAQIVARLKTLSIAQALESNLAQVLAWAPKHRLIGLAAELDGAQVVARLKSALVSQAIESDLSQALTTVKALAVAQAIESDLSQALTIAKALTVMQAIEADLSQILTAGKTLATGQASETDMSQALSSLKLKLLGLVTELDLAQPISAIGQIIVALGQVLETDLAQLLAWSPKHRLVGLASELDEAQTTARLKTHSIAQALESDLAQVLTAGKARALAQALETDLVQALTSAKLTTIAQATESDLAQAILWAPKIRMVLQAAELDLAQAITVITLVLAAIRIEHGPAYGMRIAHALRFGLSVAHDGIDELNVQDQGAGDEDV